jgi:hypothetical protein
MRDQEFLLYPLDTGEDPICPGCVDRLPLDDRAASVDR